MPPQESDSKDFDWTAVERAIETELLDRAREVAQKIVDRVRRLTGDTATNPALQPDAPTGEAPPLK